MPTRIRYDAEAVAFTVDGRQTIAISRDDAVIAPRASLNDIEVSSFEQALAEYEEQDGATVNYVFLSDVRSRSSSGRSSTATTPSSTAPTGTTKAGTGRRCSC